MASVTVESDGKITIPEELQRDLNLKTGDMVEVQIRPANAPGRIVKNGSVRRLDGIFGKFSRAVSIEEINESIAIRGAGEHKVHEEVESL
jgi:AbrB family looped-hinge helix DNA binding protein